METKQRAACPEVQDNLSAYVDGEVTKSERQLVESHLAECGACRESLSETMRVIGAVAALPRFEATPAYMARLSERLGQPRSLTECIAILLDDRRMVTGLAFGMGAAACFAVLSVTRGPVPAPGVVETSVEVAAGPRTRPVDTALASTSTAPGVGIAAGVNATGARTPGFGTALTVGSGSANANLFASVPSVTPVQPAGAPVPAPLVVANRSAAPEAVPGVSETELEGMNLQVSGDTAPSQVVAAAPAGGFSSGVRSARSTIGRAIPSGTAGAARWNPTAARTTVSTRADQEEINAAVTPPEPVVRLSELRAALPGQVPLARGETSGGAATQVMVTSAPAFLRELSGLAGQTPGVKLSGVRATLGPGLEVDLQLTGDEAAVARLAAQLNTSLGHMTTVKAVAAVSRPGTTSTLVIQIPLSAPIED